MMLGAAVLAALTSSANWCTGDRYYSCEERIVALSSVLTRAAERADLDPALLVGLAWVESRWNPWAIGPRGSVGMIQIHPVHGDVSPFMRSATYREWCRTDADGCQQPLADYGAILLASKIEACGSVRRALGWYNRGRCGGADSFVRRVMEARRRFGGDDDERSSRTRASKNPQA